MKVTGHRVRRRPTSRSFVLAIAFFVSTALLRLSSPFSLFVTSFQTLVPLARYHLSRRGRLARLAVVEGDEFKAARDRIRRIQLGLGPNDPLPEEAPLSEPEDAPTLPQSAENTKKLGALDLAAPAASDAALDEVPEATKATGTSQTAPKAKEVEDEEEAADAFAGKAKDVPELKPLPSTRKKKDTNIAQDLWTDLTLVTLPKPLEVAQTFGIVLLLVGAYTGFVAIVDYGAQQVLGQVFSEFYQAARPEAPSL